MARVGTVTQQPCGAGLLRYRLVVRLGHVYRLLFTGHCSLFTVHCLPFTVYRSLHFSLFTVWTAMPRLWQTIVSVWAWLVLVACVLLWFPVILLARVLTAPFDPGRYIPGLIFRKIAPVMTFLNPLWDFRYSGALPADPRRPYVVISNHESFTDILLISHLPWEMKWLSKAELFRIPIMGWMMWLVGDIPVKRGLGPSAVEAMARCRMALDHRVSVMIFPEGTRSRTAELLPFKDGAFRLAIEAGVPILPLAVFGTSTALRKHDWRFGKSVAEVRVLEPVETAGLGPADVPALKARLRATIIEARDALASSRAAR
jgi:1-acyl-sn-glycerol-3-phosphate acyltransferase